MQSYGDFSGVVRNQAGRKNALMFLLGSMNWENAMTLGAFLVRRTKNAFCISHNPRKVTMHVLFAAMSLHCERGNTLYNAD